jgi:hypothetical protein
MLLEIAADCPGFRTPYKSIADGHGLRDAALQALKQIHWPSN